MCRNWPTRAASRRSEQATVCSATRGLKRLWPAVLLFVLAAGCRRGGPTSAGSSTGGAASAPPLVIGAVFPLSGGAGRIGEMKRQGADLAVEHLNAAGGVRGRPLLIRYADSRNSTTEAVVAFNKLVDVDRVPVVMSAMSQVSLALVAGADRKQVVLFANASHPELTRKSPFVFRNLPSTRQTATTMADTAFRELGLRSVAVLSINDEYGTEAYRVFERRFVALGGRIAGAATFELGGTDFRATLAKLAQGKPQAWWIPGYGAALGLVLKQRAELRLPGTILCDLGLVDSNVLRTAGAAADRTVVVAPAFSPSDRRERVQRFVSAFEARYHERPSFDAACQYDAVHLIAEALRRAEPLNGETVRQALATTSGFVGVCGPTSFGEDREAQMKVVVRLMLDGRLATLERALLKPVPNAPPTANKRASTAPTDEHGQE